MNTRQEDCPCLEFEYVGVGGLRVKDLDVVVG